MIAVNLFHLGGGKIVDRRDFFWEELRESLSETLNEGFDDPASEELPCLEPDPSQPALEVGDSDSDRPITQHSGMTELNGAFSPALFFSALLKQLYLDQSYVPRSILVPVEFPDRALLADLLSERTGHRIELAVPQRGA